ncbi:MAG: SulP family inorganic anion transporter [Saprospiraceae bacterium]
MSIKDFFPILNHLTSHTGKDWRQDLIAGITVAVMLVPQGMAYAMLAGMPPIYGLYGGLLPLFLYAILGTSRQLSIGPVAISSLLVMAGVSQIAEPLTPEYISLVLLAGLLIGIVQFSLGLLRLGFLVNFISHPVIVGFTSAAAIIIAISQLKDFLGFKIPRYTHIYETLNYALQHLEQTNWVAVAICVVSIIFMMVMKRISRAIPGPLIVVVFGTALVYFVGIERMAVDIVKQVPEGLPSFQLPDWSWGNIRILLPTIFTVTIIGIVESISIAKILQSKHDYKIRSNQELLALGFSKIGGAFFQALPSSGSFTRSAVNNEAGARSGFASIFTAILIGLTLLFLTPLFYCLPKAILAAIILLSVKSLFEWEEAKHLWHSDRNDFYMMLITFVVTLGLGIEQGVLAGVVLSISMVLFKSSRPHVAVLGRLPNETNFRNVNRFEEAQELDGILILRFDDQLYFANASYFQDIVEKMVNDHPNKIEVLLLDASSIHNIDSTGIHILEAVQQFLQREQIQFLIVGLVGPVRDKMDKVRSMEALRKEASFLSINHAIRHCQKTTD